MINPRKSIESNIAKLVLAAYYRSGGELYSLSFRFLLLGWRSYSFTTLTTLPVRADSYNASINRA
jgi:hypothetical protein